MDEAISPHDVFVIHLFQKTDLANRSARHAFVFGLQSDFLERDDFACAQVSGLVDYTVCA